MTEDAAGVRLDRFVAERMPDASRSRVSAWIRDGRVTIDGVPERPSRRLVVGQEVTVAPPAPTPTTVTPQEMPLNVVFEDADLIVVDKPAGVVVHPGAGNPDGTLLNGLLHRYGELSSIGAPARPGVVHRIDAGTSGLLVFARTDEAHLHLAAQFSDHSAHRRYHALAWGFRMDDEGTIRTHYARHAKDRRKFTSLVDGGKRAVTHWTVLERLPPCTWLALQLETGRTHQIRVHLAERGQALVGDATYGGRRKENHNNRLRPLGWELGLGRQALHAAELGFVHPRTGERMMFTSDLPDDIAGLLALLREIHQ